MENALDQLLDSAPSMAGVVIVVILFLRHLAAREKRMDAIQAEANQAIRENTKAVAELRASLLVLGQKMEIALVRGERRAP